MAAISLAVSILSVHSCTRRPLEEPPVLEIFVSDTRDKNGYTIGALTDGSTTICLTVQNEEIRSYTVNVYSGSGWNDFHYGDVVLGSN
jgi:hypothetical protein